MTKANPDGAAQPQSLTLARMAKGTGLILLIPLLLSLLVLLHGKLAALVLAAVLLLCGGSMAENLVTKKIGNTAYWLAVGMPLATVFILAGINAAVGGSLEDDPA